MKRRILILAKVIFTFTSCVKEDELFTTIVSDEIKSEIVLDNNSL